MHLHTHALGTAKVWRRYWCCWIIKKPHFLVSSWHANWAFSLVLCADWALKINNLKFIDKITVRIRTTSGVILHLCTVAATETSSGEIYTGNKWVIRKGKSGWENRKFKILRQAFSQKAGWRIQTISFTLYFWCCVCLYSCERKENNHNNRNYFYGHRKQASSNQRWMSMQTSRLSKEESHHPSYLHQNKEWWSLINLYGYVFRF